MSISSLGSLPLIRALQRAVEEGCGYESAPDFVEALHANGFKIVPMTQRERDLYAKSE